MKKSAFYRLPLLNKEESIVIKALYFDLFLNLEDLSESTGITENKLTKILEKRCKEPILTKF